MPERFSIIRGKRGKHREHDLGLKPQFLDEGRDLGLARSDIEAASRVWGTITQVTGRHVELVGLFKDELEVQLGFSIKRGEREGARSEGRRRFLGNTLGVGAVVLVGGGAIITVALNYYSPEKVAERVRKERERKEKFEREQVLGTNPSVVSVAGWRVRYPNPEQDMVFLPSDGEDKEVKVISSDSRIGFSKLGILGTTEEVNTSIAINEYVKSDGTAVPRLRVKISGNPGVTSTLDTYEEWVLAEGQNVVILENVKSGEVKYLSMKRTQSTFPAFQVEVMKKVVKQS